MSAESEYLKAQGYSDEEIEALRDSYIAAHEAKYRCAEPESQPQQDALSVKPVIRNDHSVKQNGENLILVTCDYCHRPGVRMIDNYYHRTDDEREACGHAFNATLTLEAALTQARQEAEDMEARRDEAEKERDEWYSKVTQAREALQRADSKLTLIRHRSQSWTDLMTISEFDEVIGKVRTATQPLPDKDHKG